MKHFGFLIFLFFVSNALWAQEDLLKEFDTTEEEKVSSVFNSTRVVSMSSTETLPAKSLEFRIAHRFADFSKGFENLFGFDGPASILFSLDYSVLDKLTLGVGRTNINQNLNFNLKYAWLQQTKGNKIPLSIVCFNQLNITHRKEQFTGEFRYFTNRINYVNQLLISKKFNDKFSGQISPTYMFQSLVDLKSDQHHLFALPMAVRYKVSKRVSVLAEYIPRLNTYNSQHSNLYNSLSLGVDIETGGHVFQLFLTNSTPINDFQVITQTNTSWQENSFRIGFNISRVFGI